MGWRAKVKREQGRRTRRYWLAFWAVFFVGFVVWTAGVAAYLIIVVKLGGEPRGRLALGLMEGIGIVASWFFARMRIGLPMPGKAPEEHAADAFFQKRDIRSDDHEFLPGDHDAKNKGRWWW